MFPLKREEADKSTEKDANDNIPIVIHGKEHDPIGKSEMERV